MTDAARPVDAIDGVTYEVTAEAVVVRSREPLTALSSALAGGGLISARSIVNLHVTKNWQPAARGALSGWEAALGDFARRRGLATPCVGLCTSAWTEHAEVASAVDSDVTALVLVSVGLGNPVAAGISLRASTADASTINIIVVVEAWAPPAALVNLAMTVTEVKTAVLRDAGVRCPDGQLASGTSTDAVVVGATGRGRRCEFGGPISDLGAVTAHAARPALARGVAAWLERHA